MFLCNPISLQYVDKSKHQSRPRYLVVSSDGDWCMVRKFVGNTLCQLSYRLKQSECYKVPVDLAVLKLNPLKEEENKEGYDMAPAPDRSVTYHNHLISPTRDHQMTAMTNEPMPNEPNSNPISHEDGWMNGVLGHFYALSRLNWAGDNLG